MLLDTSTHIECFYHLKKTHMQLNIDQLSQLLHKFCKISSQLMWLTTIGTNDHKMPLQEMDQALLIFHYPTHSWFQRIQKFLRYQVHRSTQVPVLAPEPRNAELVLIWRPGKYGILCQGWWLHLEMASKYSELKLPVWESLALNRPSRLLVHDKLIMRHVIIHRITVQFAKWGLCLMGWHWECAGRDLFKAKNFIIGDSRSGLQSLKDMRDPCSLILPI
jgi:hypothetical protein